MCRALLFNIRGEGSATRGKYKESLEIVRRDAEGAYGRHILLEKGPLVGGS